VRLRGLSKIVFLIGERPLEEMPRFFALADLMLVTLRRDPIFSLTIPGKIQSYLACGRPVVAALDGEGARVIRESGAGLAAPAEDPAALAEAVETLYRTSGSERDKMGRSGQEYYRNQFRRELLFERLEALAKSVTLPAEVERKEIGGTGGSNNKINVR
jgi:colanic acid biosynthesis glycosyl transferase WcaI